MRRTIEWKNNQLYLIDQRQLPRKVKMIICKDYLQVVDSIRDLAVRGAPAIGAAAAFGMVLAANHIQEDKIDSILIQLNKAKKDLLMTRPTAVNLNWALTEIWKVIQESKASKIEGLRKAILKRANEISDQDIKTNYQISENGLPLFKDGDQILTHCNTGSLATVYYGTALGVIRSVYRERKAIQVFVDETRPVLQGARLTAWELKEENIPFTLICDSTAGFLMSKNMIHKVIVGADRIAMNGDTANKIGTYSLSVLSKAHQIPFYVAAPISTIDRSIKDGSFIHIEERKGDEVTKIAGKYIAPEGINVYNPAFDVTPHENITAMITEKGIVYPPFKKNIEKILNRE